MISPNVPPTESAAQSLDREMSALWERFRTNRCDSCGKTPTVNNKIGVIGRLVYSVCADCVDSGSFTIQKPSELLISDDLALALNRLSDPAAYRQSPELLRYLPTPGRVQ